jgi:hypothetical protein
MITTFQEERFWYIRNLALGLVSYIGVTEPPVLVEKLINFPPQTLQDLHRRGNTNENIWSQLLEKPIYDGRKAFLPQNLPRDEQRYLIAREFIGAMGKTEHGQRVGLPQFLASYFWEVKDYFARVLLAPDPLVISYRKDGGTFEAFAGIFIIPPRIAAIRWDEPLIH